MGCRLIAKGNEKVFEIANIEFIQYAVTGIFSEVLQLLLFLKNLQKL